MTFHRDVAQRRGDVVPDRPLVPGDGLGAQGRRVYLNPVGEVIAQAGAAGGQL